MLEAIAIGLEASGLSCDGLQPAFAELNPGNLVLESAPQSVKLTGAGNEGGWLHMNRVFTS